MYDRHRNRPLTPRLRAVALLLVKTGRWQRLGFIPMPATADPLSDYDIIASLESDRTQRRLKRKRTPTVRTA